MATKTLVNTADVVGTYRDLSVDATTDLSVLITALDIEKSADKTIWVDGNMTYTLVVTNIDDNDPPLEVTFATVSDIIEPKIATLVPGTVEIDGTAADPSEYTFDAATGLLTVTLGTVLVGTPRTVTFQVVHV